MTAVNNLSDIVNNGLCIGCGVCQSIAGEDKIEVICLPRAGLNQKKSIKLALMFLKKSKVFAPVQ